MKLQLNGRVAGAQVGDPKLIADFYRKVRTGLIARCYWCRRMTNPAERQVDHIIRIARGGKHSVENLCCACRHCNYTKGTKMPEDFAGQYELEFG